jgi:2-keto-4-pentenoate hydratase/2-oxohepta-3-ene-1,7-dioic acid hydratase in catechol pathway
MPSSRCRVIAVGHARCRSDPLRCTAYLSGASSRCSITHRKQRAYLASRKLNQRAYLANGVLRDEATLWRVEGDIFGEHTVLAETVPLSEVQLLPPVQPCNILAVGLNYASHAGTAGAAAPVSSLQSPVSNHQSLITKDRGINKFPI